MTKPARTTDGCSSHVSGRQGDDASSDSLRADLSGVFDTIDLPVIVISHDFTVAFFNRAATAALDLAPSHIGQSPRAIRALADVPDLHNLCAGVIADAAPRRCEVWDGHRWFHLRIAPYPSSDHRIGGAVLTFTNVTAFRESIERAIYEREYTKAILNTVVQPLVVLDEALRVQTANQSFYAMFEVSREETQAVPIIELRRHTWKTPQLWALLKEMLAGDNEFQPFEMEHDFRAIGRRTLLLDARRLPPEGSRENLILLAFQDITDRKQAEERYSRLAAIVESSNDAIISKNLNGEITSWNAGAQRVFGYAPAEIVGQPITVLIPEDRLSDEAIILGHIRRGESVEHYETVRRRKDGKLIDISLTVSPILNSQGQVIGASKIARDITQHRQTAEAILEKERRFREMIDALPAAIYTTDAEGRLTHFNPAAVEMSGRTPEVGTDQWCVTWKLFNPDGTPLPHDKCPMAISLKEGRAVRGVEAIAERPDGKRVWFAPFPTPLFDEQGHVVGGINMLVDITERKQAEQALRESEAMLRLSYLAARAGTWTWDAETGALTWSSETFDLFGIDHSTPLSYESWRNAVHPEDRERADLAARQAMESGEDLNVEYRVIHPQHGVRWLASIGRLIDPVGRPGSMTGISLDISERKQAQEALSEADRRKDEFLATLAHELRNPLNPIRNAVESLRIKGPADAELQLERDVIERQVQHLTRLIDDLLDINRIARDKLELRKQPVELADIVQAAIEMSGPLIDQAGHELSVSLPDEPVWVDGDPARLSQVLMNLLNNAVKYTEPGGQIWLNVNRENGEVVITVTDTGIGIAPEKLTSLFELFYQADRTLERSQSGLGIGLSLVRRFVEMHGGSVAAHSEGLGMGSQFVVRLPVLANPPVIAAALPDGGGQSFAVSRRILVVDDNQDSAKMLAALLRLTGNEVEMAFDGVEALEAGERFGPEVVLMDIGMPRLNGFETCRRMREQPWGKDALLIAQTGWGQNEDKRRTAEAGFDAHFVKPVSLDALNKLLDKWQPARV